MPTIADIPAENAEHYSLDSTENIIEAIEPQYTSAKKLREILYFSILIFKSKVINETSKDNDYIYFERNSLSSIAGEVTVLLKAAIHLFF